MRVRDAPGHVDVPRLPPLDGFRFAVSTTDGRRGRRSPVNDLPPPPIASVSPSVPADEDRRLRAPTSTQLRSGGGGSDVRTGEDGRVGGETPRGGGDRGGTCRNGSLEKAVAGHIPRSLSAVSAEKVRTPHVRP